MVFDLTSAQLRVIRVVDLLAQMELDEERFHMGVITDRQALYVECLHRSMVA